MIRELTTRHLERNIRISTNR